METKRNLLLYLSLMEDFSLAKDVGLWDNDLQTLNKALIYAKDGILVDNKQLTVEVRTTFIESRCLLELLI